MICLARKTPKDGKEENIRVRVTPEQKQRLVEYAERHYQSMSGVVCQALDLLYAREEQQRVKWSYFGVYLFISGTENTKTEQKFDAKTANYTLCVLYNAVRKGIRIMSKIPEALYLQGFPGFYFCP